jgi:hypothetical protein
MNNKVIHRVIGAIIFLIAFVAFFMTVQPSVSFWDCGELSAASYGLQITHPPGAPFFLLMNHLLSLIPFAQNIGFRINMLSVIASSLSVLFLYLVAVRLINNYKKDTSDAVITYISAAIGALSFAFATAYWFNATESNVFGFSTFLFTLMIWVMMLWYEKADQPGSERYILFIAFILGLSPGVHLMSVLAAVPVGMIFVMKRYFTNDEQAKYTAKIFAGHVALLIVIAAVMWSSQTSSTPPTQEEYKEYDTRFKLIMFFVSVIIMGIFWKKIFNKNSFYIPFIVGVIANFAIYPGIVKFMPKLITDIGGDGFFINTLVFAILLGVLAFGVYWAQHNKKPILYLMSASALLAIIGFSVYTMIIIRANERPPMNENNPKDIKTLVSYLSREQYGDFPTFKRRFSAEPQHQPTFANYTSDLDYFWRWQMNHMYIRYLLWEYVGRESWDQDAGVKFNQLYGIPFLIGMLGLLYHFRRDWKMASLFLTTFIFMGFLICFYQNQQQAQPRDREYFYAGSWFVFSIWIAIGLSNIVEDIKKFIKSSAAAKGVTYAFLGIAFIMIPVNMFRTNYYNEDRSKNWVPWDYAYNMLQSCEPNAIIFTCGDNDTFPLWYMQDVEGVRRDVRVANLSLINTDWYIKELKNDTPYGALKVPMTYQDDQIDKLQPIQYEGKNVDLSVPPNVFKEFGVTDTNLIKKGKITYRMNPTANYGNVKAIRVQDMMVKDIIQANNWQRPIYFASTCDDASKIGLVPFLKLEGLAYRLIPESKTGNFENVNVDITSKNLVGENPAPSKTYQPGFIIRSFNTGGIFFDENEIRISYNYREAYMALANYYLTEMNNKEMCLNVLKALEQRIPRENVVLDYRLTYNIATLYLGAGDFNTFKTLSQEIEQEALKKINDKPRDVSGYYNPYTILKMTYESGGEYEKEIDLLKRMQNVTGPSQEINSEIERIKHLKDSNTIKK